MIGEFDFMDESDAAFLGITPFPQSPGRAIVVGAPFPASSPLAGFSGGQFDFGTRQLQSGRFFDAMRQQQLDDVPVLASGSRAKRGACTVGIGGVNVGAALDQLDHDGFVAP